MFEVDAAQKCGKESIFYIKLIPSKLYTVHTHYFDNHFELSAWLWIFLLQPKME